MSARRPLPDALRALRHANFRWYFCGHAVSTLGTWIQQVALAWLIYRLTESAALLGLSLFVSLIPQLLVGPWAGAWIDRHDKRKLLQISQSLLGLQAALLALLTYLEWITPSLIILLASLLGILNALDTPLRQSLLSRFVDDPADLPNALALNAMLFTCSRFIGPPIAGLLLGMTSEALCFSINALSYLALVFGLAHMRLAPGVRATGSTASVFREGLDYVIGQAAIRRLMLGVLVINLTASSYTALLPVFARNVFAGDARTLGWLWGAAGLGSLLSTLNLARHSTSEQLPRQIAWSAGACALALLTFAFSTWLPLSLLAMAVLGFGVTINNVGTNILLQGNAPEELRGRVVSLYTSTRFGFDAIGGLLAGLLASAAGGPTAMALAGGLLLFYCGLQGLLAWRR